MNTATRRIVEDELTQDLGRVLQAVRGGETIVVEDHGRPRAAIVDPFDLEILLAVVKYYVSRFRVEPRVELDDSQLDALDARSRLETTVASYLAEAISLSRAAEILGKSWAELRERFSRLGIPIRTTPADEEGARQDVQEAKQAATERRPVGLAKGHFQVPPDFFEPLPDELVDAFEGKAP